MVEIFLTLFLGALILLATFLFYHSRSFASIDIPGWNDPPTESKKKEPLGSLQQYLMLKHKGGKCPVTSFWWNSERVVSVCSPQGFKDTENIVDRPRSLFIHYEALHGSDSIQCINGTQWLERKKTLHVPLRGNRPESFIGDFVRIAHQAIAAWSSGQAIDLKRTIFNMTLQGILDTLLGNIFDDIAGVEKLAGWYHFCKSTLDKCFVSGGADTPDNYSEGFYANLEKIQNCMKKMLESRKKEEDKSIRELPLMDALIGSGYSEEEIISQMVTFLGGFHTSGYYMIWIFHYLAKYPDVQEKLFADIKERVRDDSVESLRTYCTKTDTYLQQVLDESMRTSSTAGFTAHISDKDILVDGYRVPSNTPIIQALEVAMKSVTAWDRPEMFSPDRFAPGSKHAKRGREYRPFGVSALRRCPANLFTYCMVSVYVTILVQQFTFSNVNDEEVKKSYGLTTSPQGKLWVQIERRK